MQVNVHEVEGFAETTITISLIDEGGVFLLTKEEARQREIAEIAELRQQRGRSDSPGRRSVASDASIGGPVTSHSPRSGFGASHQLWVALCSEKRGRVATSRDTKERGHQSIKQPHSAGVEKGRFTAILHRLPPNQQHCHCHESMICWTNWAKQSTYPPLTSLPATGKSVSTQTLKRRLPL